MRRTFVIGCLSTWPSLPMTTNSPFSTVTRRTVVMYRSTFIPSRISMMSLGPAATGSVGCGAGSVSAGAGVGAGVRRLAVVGGLVRVLRVVVAGRLMRVGLGFDGAGFAVSAVVGVSAGVIVSVAVGVVVVGVTGFDASAVGSGVG